MNSTNTSHQIFIGAGKKVGSLFHDELLKLVWATACATTVLPTDNTIITGAFVRLSFLE